jgi:hypothetical protein
MQISASSGQPLSQTTPMPTTAMKPAPASQPPGDDVALNRVSDLVATMKGSPAIREDAVERGKALAADPNYPPADVVNKLASLITKN